MIGWLLWAAMGLGGLIVEVCNIPFGFDSLTIRGFCVFDQFQKGFSVYGVAKISSSKISKRINIGRNAKNIYTCIATSKRFYGGIFNYNFRLHRNEVILSSMNNHTPIHGRFFDRPDIFQYFFRSFFCVYLKSSEGVGGVCGGCSTIVGFDLKFYSNANRLHLYNFEPLNFNGNIGAKLSSSIRPGFPQSPDKQQCSNSAYPKCYPSIVSSIGGGISRLPLSAKVAISLIFALIASRILFDGFLRFNDRGRNRIGNIFYFAGGIGFTFVSYIFWMLSR